MLLRTLKVERIKLTRSPVWLAFLVLPILSALIGTLNYMGNIAILQEQWYSLWTQHTLFLCYFFMPALLGIYCSYLWRLEHLNYNWNAVMTAPVRFIDTYLAKLMTAVPMVILTEAWIAILFLICGKLAGITAPIPSELSSWLLCGVLGGTAVCAMQLLISLVIRSFAVPVGIALIGGVIGLAALAKGYALFFPYSLLSLGMRANNPQMEFHGLPFLLSCLTFIVAFSVAAIVYVKGRDTVAE